MPAGGSSIRDKVGTTRHCLRTLFDELYRHAPQRLGGATCRSHSTAAPAILKLVTQQIIFAIEYLRSLPSTATRWPASQLPSRFLCTFPHYNYCKRHCDFAALAHFVKLHFFYAFTTSVTSTSESSDCFVALLLTYAYQLGPKLWGSDSYNFISTRKDFLGFWAAKRKLLCENTALWTTHFSAGSVFVGLNGLNF